jgi:hypothetical protein
VTCCACSHSVFLSFRFAWKAHRMFSRFYVNATPVPISHLS